MLRWAFWETTSTPPSGADTAQQLWTRSICECSHRISPRRTQKSNVPHLNWNPRGYCRYKLSKDVGSSRKRRQSCYLFNPLWTSNLITAWNPSSGTTTERFFVLLLLFLAVETPSLLCCTDQRSTPRWYESWNRRCIKRVFRTCAGQDRVVVGGEGSRRYWTFRSVARPRPYPHSTLAATMSQSLRVYTAPYIKACLFNTEQKPRLHFTAKEVGRREKKQKRFSHVFSPWSNHNHWTENSCKQ